MEQTEVAVVGAGAAGLAAARDLVRAGHEVTVLCRALATLRRRVAQRARP